MSNLIVTDAGLDAIIEAEKSGTAKVNVVAVALGSGQYKPSASQTALKSEIKRLTTVTGGVVAANIIHVECYDNSTDAYQAYELGVITDDGTLLAVTSQNDTVIEKAAGAQTVLAVDIVLADGSASVFNFPSATFSVPPATTEVQGVIEIATDAETLALADANRAVTPATLGVVDALAVHKAGAEKVSGAKTFLSYPLVPTPPAGDASKKAVNTEWIKSQIVDLVYPVGSIYQSTESTDPGELFGGTWEEITGCFLWCRSGERAAGTTGGSEAVTLTTNEIPAHSHAGSTAKTGGHTHTATTSQSGNHTHTRGSMNITGWVGGDGHGIRAHTPDVRSSGAFYFTGFRDNIQNAESGRTDDTFDLGFDAARSWSGNTSSSGNHNHTLSTTNNGAHTHQVTIGNTGGGKAHENMPPYLSVYAWKRVE